jgi:hypothetical protein
LPSVSVVLASRARGGFGDEGFAKAATFELAEARFFTGLFFEVAVLRADLAGVDLGLVLAI